MSPLGDCTSEAVRGGDTMVARCCILIFLAAARGIFWVVEQPRGSLLDQHPCFQRTMQVIDMWRKHIKMINYGAGTETATWLYSGDP